MREHVDGREQDHEPGTPGGVRENGRGAHGVRVDAEHVQRVRPGIPLRMPMIVRHDEFPCAVELAGPVFQRSVVGRAGVGPLPLGVLAVLPHLRQLRRGAADPGRVERAEVAQDHLNRPAVRDRVVHGQEQGAVPVVEPAQQRAQQRHLACADRACLDLEDQFLDDHVPGLAGNRRQAPDLQRHLARRAHHLVRRIGVPDHQGAQQLMARDHVVERALQHRQIHRTGDTERGNDHEPAAERPAVITLVHGEEPFLGERQRVPLGFLVQRHRGVRHCRNSLALPGLRVSAVVIAVASGVRAAWEHLRRAGLPFHPPAVRLPGELRL